MRQLGYSLESVHLRVCILWPLTRMPLRGTWTSFTDVKRRGIRYETLQSGGLKLAWSGSASNFLTSGGFRNFQRGVQATKGSEAAHSRGVWGYAPPGKFCDLMLASGTYFGSIGTSLANDAMSSCRKGVGLTINLLVCVI